MIGSLAKKGPIIKKGWVYFTWFSGLNFRTIFIKVKTIIFYRITMINPPETSHCATALLVETP